MARTQVNLSLNDEQAEWLDRMIERYGVVGVRSRQQPFLEMLELYRDLWEELQAQKKQLHEEQKLRLGKSQPSPATRRKVG